ncbi:hypothetical protein B0H63DRAFT_523333 [Podospora didyma]|uniref:Uncharacterized protein n=1 Tax=Podospora didyma TaxID=330526 RepID=A0AAE0NQS8_9PEZI|nr:hypothetical protein B0H63DRAFT_523333 [Podospora didyma]
MNRAARGPVIARHILRPVTNAEHTSGGPAAQMSDVGGSHMACVPLLVTTPQREDTIAGGATNDQISHESGNTATAATVGENRPARQPADDMTLAEDDWDEDLGDLSLEGLFTLFEWDTPNDWRWHNHPSDGQAEEYPGIAGGSAPQLETAPQIVESNGSPSNGGQVSCEYTDAGENGMEHLEWDTPDVLSLDLLDMLHTLHR